MLHLNEILHQNNIWEDEIRNDHPNTRILRSNSLQTLEQERRSVKWMYCTRDGSISLVNRALIMFQILLVSYVFVNRCRISYLPINYSYRIAFTEKGEL
jgi:hypothetical protein